MGQDGDISRAIRGLQRLAELFAERRRQLAREAGVSEAQWQVLEEVAGDGFMPSLFARRRACAPAAVSRTLRELQDAGLVRVAIAAADGRRRVYRLTAEGRRALGRLQAARGRAVEAIWEPLTPAQLRAFAELAEALAGRLEAYALGRGAGAAPASAGRRVPRARAGATRRGRARGSRRRS